MGPEATAKAHALFEHYYPIEQSTALTPTEKLPFLLEWYAAISVFWPVSWWFVFIP